MWSLVLLNLDIRLVKPSRWWINPLGYLLFWWVAKMLFSCSRDKDWEPELDEWNDRDLGLCPMSYTLCILYTPKVLTLCCSRSWKSILSNWTPYKFKLCRLKDISGLKPTPWFWSLSFMKPWCYAPCPPPSWLLDISSSSENWLF